MTSSETSYDNLSAYAELRAKRDKNPRLNIDSATRWNLAKEFAPLKIVGKGGDSLVIRSPFHKNRLISLGINNSEVSGIVPFIEYKHAHRIVENLFPGHISHIGSVWGSEYRDSVRDEVVGYDSNLADIRALASKVNRGLLEVGISSIRLDDGKGENAIEDDSGKLVYVDTLIIEGINELVNIDMEKLKQYFYENSIYQHETQASKDKRWLGIVNSICHLQEADAANKIFDKYIKGGSEDVTSPEYVEDLHCIFKRSDSELNISLNRIQKYINRAIKYKQAGHQYRDGAWYTEK